MPDLKFVDNKTPLHKDAFVWRNILAIFLFLFGLLLLTAWWMKWYTRHGQQVQLADFTGKTLQEASKLARKHDFKLVTIDSVFWVDKPGSIILQQTPEAGSFVKEDRKIYVVVTKYNADLIPLSSLPTLYGRSYEVKKAELEKGFDIRSNIAGYVYDAGPVNYIMGVIYNGDTILSASLEKKDSRIAKGSALDFILSTDTGAEIPVPDIVCMTYSAASFILTSLGLNIQEVEEDVIDDKNASFVIHQEPVFDPEVKMKSGDTMRIFLNSKKPDNCPN